MGKELYIKYLDRSPESTVKRKSEEAKNSYARIKRQLMEYIIGERVYQMDELSKLYEGTIKAHPDLDEKKLRKMWNEIIAELNA